MRGARFGSFITRSLAASESFSSLNSKFCRAPQNSISTLLLKRTDLTLPPGPFRRRFSTSSSSFFSLPLPKSTSSEGRRIVLVGFALLCAGTCSFQLIIFLFRMHCLWFSVPCRGSRALKKNRPCNHLRRKGRSAGQNLPSGQLILETQSGCEPGLVREHKFTGAIVKKG